jgi:uncharacterized membrane protein
MFEQTLQTQLTWPTRWSLIGIVAIGAILMLSARVLLHSPFFSMPRESEPATTPGSRLD